jgi:hypothetical protein
LKITRQPSSEQKDTLLADVKIANLIMPQFRDLIVNKSYSSNIPLKKNTKSLGTNKTVETSAIKHVVLGDLTEI